MEEVIGPASFSLNDELGFLVEGHDDPPAVMMPYTMAYYPEFFRRLGYADARNLLAYTITREDLETGIAERMDRLCRRVRASLGERLTIRCLNPKTLRADARTLCDIYNRAWEHNWGFVPLEPERIHELLKMIRWTTPPEAMVIIELDGRPVGMTLIAPDAFQATHAIGDGRLFPLGWLKAWRAFRRINRMRVILLGVLPGARADGISLLLYHHVCHVGAIHRKYETAECGWVDEGHHRELANIGARVTKRYVVLSKRLAERG